MPAQLRSAVQCISARIGSRAYGCYAWLLFLLIVSSCGALMLLLRRPHAARRIAHAAARLLFRLGGMPIHAEGLERLPQQPHVLLVNHSSFLDPIALIALLPPAAGYAFTTRQEFRIQKIFCPLVHSIGTIVMPPPDPRRRSTNTGRLAAALRRKHSLIIFPEGRFEPAPGLHAFHSGAFVAAALAKVPVVVAGVRGTREALRPRSWLPRRNGIELKIGRVLAPSSCAASEITQWMAAARAEMLNLTGERDASA